MTEEEIKEVKEQITFMKEYREVLQFGTFYRLKSPFEGNETVWMVTNEDRTLAIVGYYRVLNGVNQPYSRVRLQGLNPDMIYENVWKESANYTVENTVMVHIRHIREKIEIDTKKPRYVKVVWGIGYKMEQHGT